jgi:hypothetical protein
MNTLRLLILTLRLCRFLEIDMKNFDEALKDLVFEYTAVPGTSGPIEMAGFCKDLIAGVEAIDAIALGIGDADANPAGQRQAMATVTARLLFDIQVMRLLLLKESGF